MDTLLNYLAWGSALLIPAGLIVEIARSLSRDLGCIARQTAQDRRLARLRNHVRNF